VTKPVPDARWPARQAVFAAELRLLAQRIQRMDGDKQRQAELARELRRAIAAGRSDLAAGRRLLARLQARMAPDEAAGEP
jgi:hypothetical protein